MSQSTTPSDGDSLQTLSKEERELFERLREKCQTDVGEELCEAVLQSDSSMREANR